MENEEKPGPASDMNSEKQMRADTGFDTSVPLILRGETGTYEDEARDGAFQH